MPQRRAPVFQKPKPPTEAQFQRQVIDLARTLGYRTWHDTIAMRSDPGWPDLVLVRVARGQQKARLLFVELKGPRGVVSEAQTRWLEDLAAAGQETHLWKSNLITLQEIAEILR